VVTATIKVDAIDKHCTILDIVKNNCAFDNKMGLVLKAALLMEIICLTEIAQAETEVRMLQYLMTSHIL